MSEYKKFTVAQSMDFTRELSALLKKYELDMVVEEETDGYYTYTEGISFTDQCGCGIIFRGNDLNHEDITVEKSHQL